MKSTKAVSSSCDLGLSPGRLQAVLDLGVAIVAELGLERSNDVLGRWMAHHLAALIDTARNTNGSGSEEANDRCATAILEVWRHRNCLPNGQRPFERLEPALEVLAALNPDAPRSFYRRDVWDAVDNNGEESDDAKRWLDLARRSDKAARVVVEELMLRAAGRAIDPSRGWVEKVTAAGMAGFDIEVISRIVELHDKLKGEAGEPMLLGSQGRALRERLKTLTDFEEVARLVRQDIETRLKKIDLERSGSDAPSA